MSDTNDMGRSRPVIAYIIIAVALVAALILCVRWVKTRANSYAESQAQSAQSQIASSGNQGSQPAIQDASQGQQQQTVVADSATTPTPPPQASQETGSVISVPSTGPDQFIMTLIGASTVAFALNSYLRARQRLLNLANKL